MILSKGRYESEINEIEKLFKKLEFFENRNYFPSSDLDPSVYRGKTYLENWKSLIADNIYNFILSDNSIFKFRYIEDSKKVSFSFFECPFNCRTYKEYLFDSGLDEEDEGRNFIDYYENYLDQCELKDNPIMIRYDLDFNSYFSGLHPASHIHIGHKNQVRLGLKKIMYPKSFVSFVLRQAYPSLWRSIITSECEWKTHFIKEKETLSDVPNSYWKELDNSEFSLI